MVNNEHTHVLANGEVVKHTHEIEENKVCTHKHSHHSPEHKKKVTNRLSRAIGHLESVKRMVENDRDCAEVLVQLMAVKSALESTGKVILKEHMSHCIKDAMEQGDFETIEEIEKSIDYFL